MCSVDFISLVSQNIIKIWKLPFVMCSQHHNKNIGCIFENHHLFIGQIINLVKFLSSIECPQNINTLISRKKDENLFRVQYCQDPNMMIANWENIFTNHVRVMVWDGSGGPLDSSINQSPFLFGFRLNFWDFRLWVADNDGWSMHLDLQSFCSLIFEVSHLRWTRGISMRFEI